MDEDLTAEEEFVSYHKEKRLSELEILNKIGSFSKENMRFISSIKNEGILIENTKTAKKNTVIAREGAATCTITFDYDRLQVKTDGDATFCSKLREQIKL